MKNEEMIIKTLDRHEKDISDLKEKTHQLDTNIIKNKDELEKLIYNAISEANKPLYTLLEGYNKRITELENKEAQLALKEKKATRKFIWAILLYSTVANLPYIVGWLADLLSKGFKVVIK
jgi:hypothetical protein